MDLGKNLHKCILKNVFGVKTITGIALTDSKHPPGESLIERSLGYAVFISTPFN
jgi:hypothetical protein